jgi:hypothetical protein
LFLVAKCSSKDECGERGKKIATDLGFDPRQIIVEKGTVKAFLEQTQLVERLLASIPKSDDSPF